MKLELGRNLDKATIKEGSDVYFDCIIDANPSAKKVYWTHNVSKLCWAAFKITNRSDCGHVSFEGVTYKRFLKA